MNKEAQLKARVSPRAFHLLGVETGSGEETGSEGGGNWLCVWRPGYFRSKGHLQWVLEAE